MNTMKLILLLASFLLFGCGTNGPTGSASGDNVLKIHLAFWHEHDTLLRSLFTVPGTNIESEDIDQFIDLLASHIEEYSPFDFVEISWIVYEGAGGAGAKAVQDGKIPITDTYFLRIEKHDGYFKCTKRKQEHLNFAINYRGVSKKDENEFFNIHLGKWVNEDGDFCVGGYMSGKLGKLSSNESCWQSCSPDEARRDRVYNSKYDEAMNFAYDTALELQFEETRLELQIEEIGTAMAFGAVAREILRQLAFLGFLIGAFVAN